MPVSLRTAQNPFRRALDVNGKEVEPARTPGHRPDYDWKAIFLQAIMEGRCVKDAAAVAGIASTLPYYTKKVDPQFKQAWVEAACIGTEMLEYECIRRAYHGVVEPVFHRGERIGELIRYSDALLMFLLKKRDPSYRNDGGVNVINNNTNSNSVETNVQAAALIKGMLERGELGLVEVSGQPDGASVSGHPGEVEAPKAPPTDQQYFGDGLENAEQPNRD